MSPLYVAAHVATRQLVSYVHHRAVEQTSVHDVLKMFGQKFKVPPDVCRIIHSPIKMPREVPMEVLHVDTQLWNFKDQLSPSVSKVLRKSGLLSSERKT